MPKIATELRPAAVKALAKKPGVYAVGGVVGLYLQVTASTAKEPGQPSASWILRRTLANGERIKVGLGRYADLGGGDDAVGLANARKKAGALVERIALGGDPIADRKAARSAEEKAKQAAMTFRDAAPLCIKSMEAGWTNAKHAAQWTNTLREYAFPVLGDMLIEDIEMQHVLRALEREDLWKKKPETASRVRMRVEKVIAWADARAKRQRQNPARWKNNLDTQLASAKSIKKVRNHPALAIDAVPEFMTELRKMEGAGARALELAILCASRSADVRGALWGEFDLDAGVWVIPADRMKAEREHRVPLSADAVKLVRALPRVSKGEPGHDLLFPSSRGTPLSDMTLAACFKRLNEKHEKPKWADPRSGEQATPHGTARSTFRDWTAERTSYPHELAEMALAHKVANKVEAAYRRGDMFEKRRAMMDDWAHFVSTPRPTGATVVPMKRAARS
jgi:integrase